MHCLFEFELAEVTASTFIGNIDRILLRIIGIGRYKVSVGLNVTISVFGHLTGCEVVFDNLSDQGSYRLALTIRMQSISVKG